MNLFATADFRPGDLVGCSSASLAGDVINLATWGLPRWGLSHVQLVGPDLDAGELLRCECANCRFERQQRPPLLWESTSLIDEPCLIHHRVVSGVQAHPLLERICGYQGRCWHYRLTDPLQSWQFEKLRNFLFQHKDDSYDAIGAFRARGTLFGRLERQLCAENLHALYCSELVAAAWVACDVWHAPDVHLDPNRLARLALAAGIVQKPRRIVLPALRIYGERSAERCNAQ